LIEDRNKTVITRKVTAAAACYLEWRGCKPLETEVAICEGWVADVAGILNPTLTELVGLKFIKRRPKWQDGETVYRDWWDASKQVQQLMTALVEVKTSRVDFQGDKKWSLGIPVNIAYLAVPEELGIRDDELPAGWGLLEYSAITEIVRLKRVPIIQKVTVKQQRDVILEIAIRRDHHTRYQRMREFRRKAAIVNNADISRTRVSNAMRAMMSIIEGKYGSVEAALAWHGIKHIFEGDRAQLQKLWALKCRPG